ncbi:NEDD8-activating enzyme E1 regulatory subunit, partial [Gonapodya sp. JEL0774]
MKADSEGYVRVANVYRQKHLSDLSHVRRRVASLVSSINARLPPQISPSTPPSSSTPGPVGELPEWTGPVAVKDDEVERWCKNAAFVRVLRYRRVREEVEGGVDAGVAAHHLSTTPPPPFLYYVLLRATDRFFAVHHRYPGADSADVEMDMALLKKQVNSVLAGWGVQGASVGDEYVHEIVRSGASELHAVASLMGGVV